MSNVGLENCEIEELIEPLLQWYEKNKRQLPWRDDKDPYHIWVSEIMLQQTRVEAVKPYYETFMKTLPTIEDLAQAKEEDLLKLWEGLGYYNRVRNMQKAAKIIVEQYHGSMPNTAEQLQTLPGIGAYTAGAIASIAYQEAVPAVDGNVLRVFARVAYDEQDIGEEKTKKRLSAYLKGITKEMDWGQWNQSLMELGALVCLPNGQPLCQQCPWRAFCKTKEQGALERIPVKKKKIKQQREERTVLLIRDGDKILLHKRKNKGLLAGMYELVNLDGHKKEEEVTQYLKKLGLHPLQLKRLQKEEHIFSHIRWEMIGYEVLLEDVDFSGQTKLQQEYRFATVEETRKKYPVPAAFEKYVKLVNLTIGKKTL